MKKIRIRWVSLLLLLGAVIWLGGLLSKDEVVANNVEGFHFADNIIGKREITPFIKHPLDSYVKVSKGDTFAGILASNGLSGSEVFEVIRAMEKKGYDPRHILEGQNLRFRKSYSDELFDGLRLEIDVLNSLVVLLGEEIEVEYFDSNPVIDYLVAKGEVHGSLYKTLKDMGLSDRAIISFVDVFGFDVDFQRDIHPKDKFMMIYGESRENGVVRVLKAKLESSAGEFEYYRYSQDGEVGYYDKNGNSAKKALMRTPISGARLSSGYGYRVHPIMGYRKMHKGVDFAAAPGTPIYAAGDGIVEKVVSRKGGYGKYIVLRHGNNYKTLYAHMRSFARGMSRGKRVKQRQVIGYVGSTGLSTGPHLHYEVINNGKKINPSRLRLPRGKSVLSSNKEEFESYIRVFEDIEYNNISTGSLYSIGNDETLEGSNLIKRLTFLHG